MTTIEFKTKKEAANRAKILLDSGKYRVLKITKTLNNMFTVSFKAIHP